MSNDLAAAVNKYIERCEEYVNLLQDAKRDSGERMRAIGWCSPDGLSLAAAFMASEGEVLVPQLVGAGLDATPVLHMVEWARMEWADAAAQLPGWLETKIAIKLLAAQRPSKQKKQQRQRSRKQIRPLTPRQQEVLHEVGTNQGDRKAAAAALGITRQAIDRTVKVSLNKMGKQATAKTTGTIKRRNLPHDGRGQVAVSEDDATT